MDRIRALKLRRSLLFAAFALSGCAAAPPADDGRFMTKEQDAEFRERCAADGCAIVPLPLMEKIMRQLKTRGA